MTVMFRVVLVTVCILTCCYTLHKIRKSQMQIEDSLFWIIISMLLVVISTFPQIPDYLAKMLGIGATVNFVFLAMIFILVMKVFSLSLKLSQMEYRFKNLVQKIAIKENANEIELKNIKEFFKEQSDEKLNEGKKE